MLVQVHSFVSQGIDPIACEVEVDVADRGLAKKFEVVNEAGRPMARMTGSSPALK